MSTARERNSVAWQARVVTGGAGFLGGFLVETLRRHGASDVIVPRSRD
jgi:nucleoside-diphosphate-sugar epimerase